MSEFLLIAGAHLLAVMSPGPDFVMITTRTLQSGKKAGIFVAIGLWIGILWHSIFALLWLTYIIERSIVIFTIIKIIGSLYLLWMAWHLLHSKKSSSDSYELMLRDAKMFSVWQNIKTGFLTNILNPKASLFFLAVFSQVVSPKTSLFIKSLYASEMVMMTILWFSLVAWTIDKKTVRNIYIKIRHWIDRAMGAVLAALGLRLLFTSRD
jgi:RhtB (resistance to homoserine/threonine) family protein